MQVSRLMQPGKEGLVIATSNDYNINDYLAGKLFLWYYGRPRRFYKGDTICSLTYHDGKLLGMQDNNHGGYYHPYALRDILEDRIVLDEKFDYLYSDGERLYGTKETNEWIEVHENSLFYSYNPIEIGRIFDSKFETDFIRHMFVVSLASDGENVFLSEKKFPAERLIGSKGARCVKIFGKNEETLLDLGEVLPPYCLLPTDKGLLAGVEFGIWNVTNNGAVEYFSEAHNYFTRLRDIWGYELDSYGFDLVKRTQKFLRGRNIPLFKQDDEEINELLYWKLSAEFCVRYIVEFQDELVYATNHELYISGNEKPIWTFRDHIMGLAVVDSEDLLRKLKGETSVRGAKNAEIISLPKSLKIAA